MSFLRTYWRMLAILAALVFAGFIALRDGFTIWLCFIPIFVGLIVAPRKKTGGGCSCGCGCGGAEESSPKHRGS